MSHAGSAIHGHKRLTLEISWLSLMAFVDRCRPPLCLDEHIH